ncbi:MAG: DUF3795 domain-containing protein [Deltaproteobacteria bacterium]|nr:DUF3795 domain-containing protein [Deltaproteobacteria bacterium]
MDYHEMTSPCGLDCWNCPMYRASKDEQIRQAVGKELNMSPDKVSCQGCRNQGGLVHFLDMTEPCPIFRCVQKKEHHFCSECDDFPCDLLHPLSETPDLLPCNIKVFNLCLIKRMGVEKWAEEKARRVRKTYSKKMEMYDL